MINVIPKIYLTGLQQVGDFTFEGAARSDDNSQFGRHGTSQTSAIGNSSKVIASLLPTGHLIRHQIWGNCMASTEIRIWTRRKANSGKARLKA